MGIIPATATPGEDGENVEETTLVKARLDSYIATCLAYVQDDGSSKNESHQQKMCLIRL